MSYRVEHPDVEGDAVIPERSLAHHAERGWVLTGRTTETPPAEPVPVLKRPSRSASAAEWKTYAVVDGMDYDAAMAMTHTQLVEHYNPTPPKPETPAKTPKES